MPAAPITNKTVLVSRAQTSQQCYSASHSVVFRSDKHFGTYSAPNQPASSSVLCPRRSSLRGKCQNLHQPRLLPGWWQPSSGPTHQGAEPGSLPIFFKTGKSSSPKLWEAHRSWLPWYRQGTTPTASGLSAQVNGLSLLRYSYSQRRQERALRGKNSPLLRKHLLFHSQHTHLHPAHLPAACPPNQQHGRPAVP